jgi:SulP family sulfate permease
MTRWVPQSVRSLKGYDAHTFLSDAVAGATVGLVALPLAMAFAIASGMPPQAGIYTAVIAGFLTSALGGTLTAIGGPTGAFVVVVAGIIAEYGIDGLFMCTMMAGVILVALGASQVGSAIKYIPRPVIIGFTNGIAVLIASTQIRDFFGLQVPRLPDDFVSRMRVLAQNFHTLSAPTTAVGLTTLAILVLLPRIFRKIPGAIVAMIGVTIAASIMGLPIETIGTRFGGVPSGLPHLQIPHFRASLIPVLLAPQLL